MADDCARKITLKFKSTLLVWYREYILDNSAMFSVFPPFYHGVHSAILGWITLIFVFLMHVFAMVRKCDQ